MPAAFLYSLNFPAAYLQYVFPLHTASEQVQCTSDGHIHPVSSQFPQKEQIFHGMDAARICDGIPGVTSEVLYQILFDPPGLPFTSTAWIRNSPQYADSFSSSDSFTISSVSFCQRSVTTRYFSPTRLQLTSSTSRSLPTTYTSRSSLS